MSKATYSSLKDCRGVPVSYSSMEAIHALEEAHFAFLAFSGNPLAQVDEIIEEFPDFLLAHLFRAAYLTQLMEARVHDDLLASINNADKLLPTANDRDRAHCLAVKAWASGNFIGAVQEWERALSRYPHDLLALQLIHLSNVLLGRTAAQRDIVINVFDSWNGSIAGFEFVLGFYAFGLEENAEYPLAERLGLEALELRAENPYAVHAVCHVLEMQGRHAEGLQFMREHGKHWMKSGFAIHLWWHTALFYLDLQLFDSAFEIYDSKLRSSKDEADQYEDLDAAALLWRFKLAGLDVGDRWKELADKWEPAAKDTVYAFNTVHAMMSLTADCRHSAAALLLESCRRYADQSEETNASSIWEIGLPFCIALEDFEQERYSECVDRLLAVRCHAEKLGGSFVQRDVMEWTLSEATIRAERYDLAVDLTNARCLRKPTSPQRWLDLARAQRGSGAGELAKQSELNAKGLVAEYRKSANSDLV